MSLRIGLGFDLHRLGPGSRLILGGVEIPYDRSFIAHSDGDVLCHDALRGQARQGSGPEGTDAEPEDRYGDI